jgi:hypothetical protein
MPVLSAWASSSRISTPLLAPSHTSASPCDPLSSVRPLPAFTHSCTRPAPRHCDDNDPDSQPYTIVTASVDHINLLQKLHPDRWARTAERRVQTAICPRHASHASPFPTQGLPPLRTRQLRGQEVGSEHAQNYDRLTDRETDACLTKTRSSMEVSVLVDSPTARTFSSADPLHEADPVSETRDVLLVGQASTMRQRMRRRAAGFFPRRTQCPTFFSLSSI